VSDAYEGSYRQRRIRRRARVVAIVVAVAMLAPIVIFSAAAIKG
jgi:hypothetical protein